VSNIIFAPNGLQQAAGAKDEPRGRIAEPMSARNAESRFTSSRLHKP